MSPHTQRVRGLAHAWLLIRDVCGFAPWSRIGMPVHHRGRCGPLRASCYWYQSAVERYGAGPR